MAVLIASLSFAACGTSGDVSDVNSGITSVNIDSSSSTDVVTHDAFNYLTGEYNMSSDMVGVRPIAVSINNITAAWPDYSTSKPDILFEMETEGGIPRYMALFADIRGISQIGSVRSLRDQFIELVYPYDALICHIGTSIYADAVLSELGLSTLDGDAHSDLLFIDQSRVGIYSTEHTKFTSADRIYQCIDELGIDMTADFTSTAFNFVDEDETVTPSTGTATQVNWQFSSSYDGDFRYNESTGKYEKWECGEQQIDASNNEPLAFDNVFLILAPIQLRAGTPLIEVDFSTGGTAYYFSNGHYQLCNWTKGSGDYSSNFKFTDATTGEEIQVNTGKSYVAVIRTDFADTVSIA